jgi:uncharacterized protein YbjT (DUF2867 family)
MPEKILVMGASGTVGHYVLTILRSLGKNAVGASRDIGGKGHGWVRLDLLDNRTFERALEGVTKVLLVSRPGDEEADSVAAPFIEAMVHQQVQHVVVLSALGAQSRPEFSLRRLEKAVEASGLPWTHIRPNFFMQMLATGPLVDEIRECRTLSLPVADARIAYVDALDVAEAIAMALCDDNHKGKAYDVNGSEALDHSEITAILSRACNQPIKYQPLTSDAGRALLLQRGFPPLHAKRVMLFYELIRAGRCAPVDRDLASMLGRPLTTWREFVVRNVKIWQRELEPAES